MKKLLLLLISIISLSQYVNAQDESSIVTDRPSFTTAAYTVPKGWVQLESGFSFARNKYTQDFFNFSRTTTERSTVFNSSLVRFGISRRSELRFTQGYDRFVAIDENGGRFTEAGFSATVLGIKSNIYTNEIGSSKLSFLADLGLNVLDSDKATFIAFSLLYDGSFGDGFSYTANFGSSLAAEGFGAVDVFYGLAFAKSIGENIGVFIEPYGFIRSQFGVGVHNLNAGVQYLLSNTLQIDFAIGTGFSRPSPDYALNFGISKLFR